MLMLKQIIVGEDRRRRGEGGAAEEERKETPEESPVWGLQLWERNEHDGRYTMHRLPVYGGGAERGKGRTRESCCGWLQLCEKKPARRSVRYVKFTSALVAVGRAGRKRQSPTCGWNTLEEKMLGIIHIVPRNIFYYFMISKRNPETPSMAQVGGKRWRQAHAEQGIRMEHQVEMPPIHSRVQ